jgi:ATP-dependent Clp protease ATP-binding subunit ClpB
LIIFHGLGVEEIKAIVEIQVKKLEQRLTERRIELKMTEKAKEWLAKEGFDPAYGARPLKRVIQKEIQDRLAMKILEGKFKEGDTITVDVDGKKGELVFRV